MYTVGEVAKGLMSDRKYDESLMTSVDIYGILGTVKDPFFEKILNIESQKYSNASDSVKVEMLHTPLMKYLDEHKDANLLGVGVLYGSFIFNPDWMEKKLPGMKEAVRTEEGWERLSDMTQELINLASTVNKEAINLLVQDNDSPILKIGSYSDMERLLRKLWTIVCSSILPLNPVIAPVQEIIERFEEGVLIKSLGFDYKLKDERTFSLSQGNEAGDVIYTNFQNKEEGTRQLDQQIFVIPSFESIRSVLGDEFKNTILYKLMEEMEEEEGNK